MRHAPSNAFRDRVAASLAVALGLFCLVNGAVMLAAPARWFLAVPGVRLTGGYNAHFIRDIGIFYALNGAGLLLGAARRDRRPMLWGLAAAWLGAHAAFHLVEVASGLCGPDAIPRDFVGVTLPALLAIPLALFAARSASTIRNDGGRPVTNATVGSS